MMKLLFGPQAYWQHAIILLRIWIGVIFISHGLSMWNPESMQSFTGYLTTIHIPFPLLNAYLCKASEFFGGVFLVVGFLKRPACLFLIIDMIIATFVAGHGQLLQEGRTPFILLICCLTFFLSPTDKLSMDWIISKRTVK